MDPFQRALLENQIVIMNILATQCDAHLENELDERIEITKNIIKAAT